MNHITVYSKDNCPACATVIAFLKTQGTPHTVLKLNEAFDLDFIRQKFPDAKSFPIVVTTKTAGTMNEPELNEYTGANALAGVRQFLLG